MRPLDTFGHRVRVRVAALLFDDDRRPGALLLLEHDGLYDEPFWTPPGGEVQFGEALDEALRREVEEETGLEVEIGALRYTLDFVRPPLHAVSFYFRARAVGGTLGVGRDPELETQLIRRARYVPFDELDTLSVVPEGLPDAVREDVAAGFAGGARYLGTKR